MTHELRDAIFLIRMTLLGAFIGSLIAEAIVKWMSK